MIEQEKKTFKYIQSSLNIIHDSDIFSDKEKYEKTYEILASNKELLFDFDMKTNDLKSIIDKTKRNFISDFIRFKYRKENIDKYTHLYRKYIISLDAEYIGKLSPDNVLNYDYMKHVDYYNGAYFKHPFILLENKIYNNESHLFSIVANDNCIKEIEHSTSVDSNVLKRVQKNIKKYLQNTVDYKLLFESIEIPYKKVLNLPTIKNGFQHEYEDFLKAYVNIDDNNLKTEHEYSTFNVDLCSDTFFIKIYNRQYVLEISNIEYYEYSPNTKNKQLYEKINSFHWNNISIDSQLICIRKFLLPTLFSHFIYKGVKYENKWILGKRTPHEYNKYDENTFKKYYFKHEIENKEKIKDIYQHPDFEEDYNNWVKDNQDYLSKKYNISPTIKIN